jgi:hypothetical protein
LQQLQHVSMRVALGLAIHACSFADAESDGDNDDDDDDSRTSVR